MSEFNNDRTPVSVITGFLGSGKTTLLNHLLAHPGMADAAVIINEFGEIALDHLLVATPQENMVLLSSGCLCCTVRGDLVDTLGDLYRKRAAAAVPPFASVVIETTGLADPVPILQTVMTDEEMAPLYTLDGVVTLVDGVNGAAQLDAHQESVKQAAVADRLLITKTDLAQRAGVEELRGRLARINPGAAIYEVLRGEIAPQEIFGCGVYDVAAREPQVARWLREEAFEAAGHHHEDGGRHAEVRIDVNRHDDHIRAFCIYYDKPIHASGLVLWLNLLAGLRGANLLRVKGLLNVEGRPVVINAVQTLVHEPVTLGAWPGEDRRSRLVFITRDMERAEIERTLGAFELRAERREGAPAIDPEEYARFLAVAKRFR